jgi:2'-aminobiphenyl-2,3-diol 1,2-dioxygenase, large subunit
MAKLVSAVATSHILMSPAGAEAPAQRVFDGMLKIGRHVRAARPDVLITISSDHMFNIGPEISAPFLAATGASFTPFGEMDIPREEYRGVPEFAQGFIDYAGKHSLPVAPLKQLHPDHGTAIPLLFANPDRDIKVVPLFINYDLERVPSPADCWQFGTLLRDYIAQHPGNERVAVVGAGGLSHWVGYENATVNEAFDRRFLSAMESGQLQEWRARAASDIRTEAGNGGLEIMSWLAVAAAVPQARAETVYYEPMPSWLTGMGGVVMKWPQAAAEC